MEREPEPEPNFSKVGTGTGTITFSEVGTGTGTVKNSYGSTTLFTFFDKVRLLFGKAVYYYYGLHTSNRCVVQLRNPVQCCPLFISRMLTCCQEAEGGRGC